MQSLHIECRRSYASAALFNVYKGLRMLDVGITKLFKLDIHGLLRVIDVQNILEKNTQLRDVQIKNFEWKGQAFLEFGKLKELQKLRVFADNPELNIVVGADNRKLEYVEVGGQAKVDVEQISLLP